MKSISQSLLLVLALALSVSAQFQFFEQFFGGEQQQHQSQDVASDSSWFQQNYAKGMPLYLTSATHELIQGQRLAPSTSAATAWLVLPSRK